MKLTQTNEVLEHLKTHGTITSIEAIMQYGATRLSAIIFDLRKEGHNIETQMVTGKNRRGGSTTFARYVYKGGGDGSN